MARELWTVDLMFFLNHMWVKDHEEQNTQVCWASMDKKEDSVSQNVR